MDRLQPTETLAWRERPLRELIRLAWPIAISHVSFSVMTAVDTMFVGRLGSAALAGVALGGIAVFTLLCFGIGLLRSTKITVSQAVGAGRAHAAGAYLGASLWVAFGLGVAVALLGQVVAAWLPMLTTGHESGAIAREYSSLRFLAAPIVLATVALRETRHGLGDARSPMIATLIANVANVGLVALFLLQFEWGIAGVAWATTFAQVIEALVLASMQRARGFGQNAWTLADLRLMLRMGLPLGVERFFDVGSFSLMVALCARMGDNDLAAHQVANQALMFAFLPGFAISEAACVLIGQAVGAASFRSVPRVQRSALAVSYAYAAVCGSLFVAFGHIIAGWFTPDREVITRAADLFRIAGAVMVLLPLYQIGQASLRAIGDVRFAAWVTVIAAWGGMPIFTAVFGLGFGMGAPGGWFGLTAEMAVASFLFWQRLRGEAWIRTARRCRAQLRRVPVPAAAAPDLGFPRTSDPGPPITTGCP